jgi:hypothetical protein
MSILICDCDRRRAFFASQSSICLRERNYELDIAARIENLNFARAKPCAIFGVIDYLRLLWENRLDPARFQKLSSPSDAV